MNTANRSAPYLLGILVGGKSSRMGGVAKGTLRLASGKSIVESIVDEFRGAASDSAVVLLGEHPAYAKFGLPQLADSPNAAGPMGGVLTLLMEAEAANRVAVLVGCDMPFIDCELFSYLLRADSLGPSLAPRIDNRWQPLFSRHDPADALSVLQECLREQRYSLQHWLTRLSCTPLPLSPPEQAKLQDWDAPEDIRAHAGKETHALKD